MFPAGNTKMTIATMSCSLSNVVQACVKTVLRIAWFKYFSFETYYDETNYSSSLLEHNTLA